MALSKIGPMLSGLKIGDDQVMNRLVIAGSRLQINGRNLSLLECAALAELSTSEKMKSKVPGSAIDGFAEANFAMELFAPDFSKSPGAPYHLQPMPGTMEDAHYESIVKTASLGSATQAAKFFARAGKTAWFNTGRNSGDGIVDHERSAGKHTDLPQILAVYSRAHAEELKHKILSAGLTIVLALTKQGQVEAGKITREVAKMVSANPGAEILVRGEAVRLVWSHWFQHVKFEAVWWKALFDTLKGYGSILSVNFGVLLDQARWSSMTAYREVAEFLKVMSPDPTQPVGATEIMDKGLFPLGVLEPILRGEFQHMLDFFKHLEDLVKKKVPPEFIGFDMEATGFSHSLSKIPHLLYLVIEYKKKVRKEVSWSAYRGLSGVSLEHGSLIDALLDEYVKYKKVTIPSGAALEGKVDISKKLKDAMEKVDLKVLA